MKYIEIKCIGGIEMFKNIIVRRPCKGLVEGITTANLGKPDYELALKQHDKYIETLRECGVNVTVLEANEEFPDSCFVEDVALCTRKCVIFILDFPLELMKKVRNKLLIYLENIV